MAPPERNPERRRLTLVIHSLGPGGAERVASLLAHELAVRGWKPTILTLAGEDQPVFYPVPGNVSHRPLALGRTTALSRVLGTILPGGALAALKRVPLAHLWNLLVKLRRLRKSIQDSAPNVVLSFMDTTNVMTLMATRCLGLPVVVSERCDPGKAPLGRFWRFSRRLLYPRAAGLVVLSEDVRRWFPPSVQSRTQVIANPVLPPSQVPVDRGRADAVRIVMAVGRLSEEKGFDLLLEAFSRVIPDFPQWRLEVWGEGPLRLELEGMRDRLGLRDHVDFRGLTREIHAQYERSDLFVLSSRSEGFPNALCEAMAHGLPVVATACGGGVMSIVRPGVDGILVPPEDPAALAEALALLLRGETLRASMGTSAREVTVRFGLAAVVDQWEDCLLRASERLSR